MSAAAPSRRGLPSALEEVAEDTARWAAARIGPPALHAIVLTGSVARGEHTLLDTPAGGQLALSDVEFLVILRRPFRLRRARRALQELGHAATQRLRGTGLRPVVEFVPAGLDYLRNVSATIFTCDLQRHGRIAWGRDVLAAMPALRNRDIPPLDAIRLLMNRMVEQACTPAGTDRESAWRVGYQAVKSALDCAGSALAFRGRYVSEYSARPRALRDLAAEDTGLRAIRGGVPELVDLVTRAAACKAAPTPGLLEWFARAATRASVLTWARALWLWEVSGWRAGAACDPPRAIEEYLRHERVAERARGWVKYLWHPLRPRGRTSWRRLPRLICRASPQALAYAAALLAEEGRRSSRPALEREAASLLPTDAAADQALEEAADLWRWLVRNN